jgi:hypothetical protein
VTGVQGPLAIASIPPNNTFNFQILSPAGVIEAKSRKLSRTFGQLANNCERERLELR